MFILEEKLRLMQKDHFLVVSQGLPYRSINVSGRLPDLIQRLLKDLGR